MRLSVVGRIRAASLIVMVTLLGIPATTVPDVKPQEAERINSNGLAPHSPIAVRADYQFTAENGVTGGSGTISDPYIIEGWLIDASSAPGITIYSTSASFIIRNVEIRNGGVDNPGIALYSVSTGMVENTTMVDCSYGVLIDGSSGVTVVGTSASQSRWAGIQVSGSSSISVTGNSVTGNGFGIRIRNSRDSTFDGNQIVANLGMAVFATDSLSLIFRNNQVSDNPDGIIILGSDGTSVVGNQVTGNGGRGLYFDSTSGLTATWNNLSNNQKGMHLYFSYGNVHHNSFLDNSIQGQRTGGDIFWDDGYPSGGNWWYDYTGRDECSGPNQDICPDPDGIGDLPYTSGGQVLDRYPLIPPSQRPFVSFTVSEMDPFPDEIVTFDASASYDADGTIAAYEWLLGDGTNLSGVVVSHAYGSPGLYTVTLTVRDNEGNHNSVIRSLNVRQEIPLVVYDHVAGFRVPIPGRMGSAGGHGAGWRRGRSVRRGSHAGLHLSQPRCGLRIRPDR